MDITEAGRFQGRFPAGGAGWQAIAEPAVALRWALAAVLSWWPVLWRDLYNLFGQSFFGQSFPNLQALASTDVARAVQNLPDEAPKQVDAWP
mmetsp:Transcript_35974/g.95836  ORF Transcript_35974/g.95836 Transcript_35974/m.95836 type:complete len:92 (+) Transcript_35974:214-489(+)